MKLTSVKVWIGRDEELDSYFVYGTEPEWIEEMGEFSLPLNDGASNAVAKLCADEFESLTGITLEAREVIQGTLEINLATLTKAGE